MRSTSRSCRERGPVDAVERWRTGSKNPAPRACGRQGYAAGQEARVLGVGQTRDPGTSPSVGRDAFDVGRRRRPPVLGAGIVRAPALHGPADASRPGERRRRRVRSTTAIRRLPSVSARSRPRRPRWDSEGLEVSGKDHPVIHEEEPTGRRGTVPGGDAGAAAPGVDDVGRRRRRGNDARGRADPLSDSSM